MSLAAAVRPEGVAWAMTSAQITLQITSAVEEACMLLCDGSCDLVRCKSANQASLGGNTDFQTSAVQDTPITTCHPSALWVVLTVEQCLGNLFLKGDSTHELICI